MPKSATTSSLSDYQKLPIKQCKDSLNTNSQALSISYQYHGKAYAYDLAVTRTSCHYGGQRYWWLCPKCKKSVIIDGWVCPCCGYDSGSEELYKYGD